jgi:molybdopterin synthase catalytic subunit
VHQLGGESGGLRRCRVSLRPLDRRGELGGGSLEDRAEPLDARLHPLGSAHRLHAREVGGWFEAREPGHVELGHADGLLELPLVLGRGRRVIAAEQGRGDPNLASELPVDRTGRGLEHALDLAEERHVVPDVPERDAERAGHLGLTHEIILSPVRRDGRSPAGPGGFAPYNGRVRDRFLVRITADPLDAAAALAFVEDPGAGGTCVFLGTVRNRSDAGEVTSLTYEAWDELAVRRLEEIAGEMLERWPLCRVAILHRTGDLSVGEVSVVVACSAPHRAEAFDGCRHGIERLKRDVPIWKREHLVAGESRWVMGS